MFILELLKEIDKLAKIINEKQGARNFTKEL